MVGKSVSWLDGRSLHAVEQRRKNCSTLFEEISLQGAFSLWLGYFQIVLIKT